MKQRVDTQLTFNIKWLPSTTSQQFKYIQFCPGLQVLHNRVFQQQNKLVFYFSYANLWLDGMIFKSFFGQLTAIWLIFLPLHLWVFLALFKYAYITQNQIAWCDHLHQSKRCQVLNLYEYISCYELNLMLIRFKLCKIELLRE